jgi:hypothetical protein
MTNKSELQLELHEEIALSPERHRTIIKIMELRRELTQIDLRLAEHYGPPLSELFDGFTALDMGVTLPAWEQRKLGHHQSDTPLRQLQVICIVAYFQSLKRRDEHREPDIDIPEDDTPIGKTKELCKDWKIHPVGNRPVTKITITKWRKKFGETDQCEGLTQRLLAMDPERALATINDELRRLNHSMSAGPQRGK